MTSILHTIAEHAKVRVEEAKKQKPLSEVKKEALAMEPLSGFPFEKHWQKAISVLSVNVRRHPRRKD